MKHDLFLGDLSHEIGELNDIESKNYHFEQYEFKEIEGEMFIAGIGMPTNLDHEGITLDGPDLLFSLIRLVNNPIPRYLDKIYLDPVIPDEEVMKWVQINGIPYTDKRLNLKLKDKLIRPTILSLFSFKYQLAWLYDRFSLWKALIEEDEETINKLKNVVENEMGANVVLRNKKEKNELIAIKTALAESVNTGVNLQLIYDRETSQYKFVLKSQYNLFNVAYHQFAALMTKPPTENKKKMKTCASCNSLFWANHASTRYCPNCDRRTVWSRKKRNSQ